MPIDEPPGTVQAGPSAVGGVVQLGAAGLLALVLLLGGLELAGAVLAFPVMLALAGMGLRDLLLRPVISADSDTLTVVRGLRRVRTEWPDVARVRVVTDRRAALLELDLDGALVVLSRRRLGRAPADVLAELDAVRPHP